MSDVAAIDQHDAPAASKAQKLAQRWARVEAWFERVTDRANPILVKETRQALKSRQFVISFLIVLVGCWIEADLVVLWTTQAPRLAYRAAYLRDFLEELSTRAKSSRKNSLTTSRSYRTSQRENHCPWPPPPLQFFRGHISAILSLRR